MKEKILIALSDASLLSILSTALAHEGYILSTAKTGEEVLKKLQTETPDLLLIDLVLPGKNGYDVLAEKTLDRLTTKIPVIIISNTGSTVEMRRIPSTPSIRGYVINPHVEPKEVLQKVGAVFAPPAPLVAPSVPSAPTTSSTASSIPRAPRTMPNPPPVPVGDLNKKAPTPSRGAGKKILWAEDDKFLGTILFKKFESTGHIVLKASDGEEAIKILETETPHIIVLDILLPGLSGFEILQKVKMNEKHRNIPVIMLSNLNKPSDIEKAKLLGAQKFLLKAAVSLDEIVREVDALL